MFNDSFYPTPKDVIRKMIEPYAGGKLEDLVILEPSAGKGDIIDYLKGQYKPPTDIYAIEQEPELKMILQGKGYRVIADDFLTYSSELHFDLIIMNPPFANGDEHLLKAWEVSKGGDIVCLLNEDTIKNPRTAKRKMLQTILQEHGQVEYLGPQFYDSERSTKVHIALIRLKKPIAKGLDFEFEQVTKERGFNLSEESFQENGPAVRNKLNNMIIQFDKMKVHFLEYMKQREAIDFYADFQVKDILEAALGESTRSKKFNAFCDSIRASMWAQVMSKMDIKRFMTQAVRENFSKFSKEQGHMDFTRENVEALFQLVFENKYNILEKAIGDVFDLFTRWFDGNKCHIEGWKTNDKWKVNRKVIVPYGVSYGSYMSASSLREYGDKFTISHRIDEHYSDIDKVMCFIDGKDYDSIITIKEALDYQFQRIGNVKTGSFDNICESEFFRIKFWKKGTLHLEFKDKFLHQEFNMRACNGKNWLPETEKQQWYNRSKDRIKKERRLQAA